MCQAVEDSIEHQYTIPAIALRKPMVDPKMMGTKERTAPDNNYIRNGGLWLRPDVRLMV